jgi:hypothetical protein
MFLVVVILGIELLRQHQFLCFVLFCLFVSCMVTGSPASCVTRLMRRSVRKQVYMAYKFVTTEPTLIVISPISGEFVAEQFYHLYVAQKQNLCGRRFKDDCQVETAVAHDG